VLDAVVDYLPSPTEVKPQPEVDLEGNETGEFAIVDPDKPLRALAFKIMDDRFGALTFTRIYSGKIKKGDTCSTPSPARPSASAASSRCTPTTARSSTRPGRRHRRAGRHEEHPDRPHAVRPEQPGDAGADGLPGPGDLDRHRAEGQGVGEKMGVALNKMVAEDPSFRVETDEESGETIIKGMGELHLDIKVDILKRTHGVEVDVGKPQVAYRETSPGHRRQLHPQEADRWFRSVRQDRLHHRAGRAGRLRVRVHGHRRQRAAEFWPAVEKGFKT
jgi:elongation factor G